MSTEKSSTRTRTEQDEMAALRQKVEALEAEKKAREEAERKAAVEAAKRQEEEDRRVKVFVKIRRDQPSQIWDAKNGRVMAEFDRRGICQVQDPKVAKELRKRGYVECPPGSKPQPTPLAEPNPFMSGYIEVV
jgi:hypothetical protein